MILDQALSTYRFLTYSRDQETGGLPLDSLLPEAYELQFDNFKLIEWYRQKQDLVKDISQNFETLDSGKLCNLCNRLENLFSKHVLQKVITDASDATLDEIEKNRVLLSQTNLAPHLIQNASGNLSAINPFLLHKALESPHHIKEIDLSDNHYLSDSDLQKICQSFPYLQRIHLKDCYYLTKASLFTLSELHNLDFLTIHPGVFESLTTDELAFLTFRNLKHVGFGDHTHLISVAFSWMNNLPSLAILDLSRVEFAPQFLGQLTHPLGLVILDDHEFLYVPVIVEALAKLNINTISLQRTNLEQSDFLRLITLSNERASVAKRSQAAIEDATVPSGNNLHSIIVESGRFIDPGFLRECQVRQVVIEARHRRDASFDESFGSSFEDNFLNCTTGLPTSSPMLVSDDDELVTSFTPEEVF